jgi:hypothetical protein
MKFFFCFLLFISFSIRAEVNFETHEFSFEYGLTYHTLKESQKNNNSRGRLSSNQLPYWNAAYTVRLGRNFGMKLFGGIQLLRFEEPAFGTLHSEFDSLSLFGLELIQKTGPISKLGIFIMQQEHPLYRAIGPTDFEVFKLKFAQGGLHFQLGQRRRIGLLWGLGLKAFALFPTKGGDVATESGVGGEAYVRLGLVGPLGTLHQIKGFYQGVTAPNAEIEFSHELLGYAYLLSISF